VTLSKKNYALLCALAAVLIVGGCKKKETAPPPPPPPPPAAPTAALSANPDSITAGQSTTLTWRTENANDVNIEGIGKVDASGTQSVTPQASTTYRLTAKGPGGTQDATARVTVEAAPVQTAVTQTDEELFAANVKDVFFDYDSYAIRADAQQQVAADAAFLKQHPTWKFTIEGHCDERGSTEYNLALGDSRANAARDALTQAGVSAGNIKTISYGKEKPFCNESNEACWQQNRRAHFVLTK
jgi:peptidoglycan-associated lipoprotein